MPSDAIYTVSANKNIFKSRLSSYTMNKRGISGVIVTVLIILVVLATIIIVWNVVQRVIKEKSGEIGIEKFSVGLSTGQVNLSENPIKIRVERDAGQGDISAIKIIFKNKAGASYEYNNDTLIPKELETLVYYINRTLVVNAIGENIDSFEVYPVFIVSGKETIGLQASHSGGGGSSDNEGNTISCPDGETPHNGICVIQISGCQNLTQTGKTYLLMNSDSTTGTCFTIKNNSITLDMNGFNITGNGTYGDNGVYSHGGYNQTTIKNGGIYNFRSGIYFDYGSNNIFTNITLSGNFEGIILSKSSNNILTSITANNNSDMGIILEYGSNNTLTSINANNNKNTGIYLYESSNNNITGITANDNNAGTRFSYGIQLYSSLTNSITNITANNNSYGISFFSSSNNTLTNITANKNNIMGIYLSNSNNNKFNSVISCSNISIYYDLYCDSSSGNSGTGNTFGSVKVQACSDGWPVYPDNYAYC